MIFKRIFFFQSKYIIRFFCLQTAEALAHAVPQQAKIQVAVVAGPASVNFGVFCILTSTKNNTIVVNVKL